MKIPLLPLATAVLGIAVGFIGGKAGGAGGDGGDGKEAAERRGGTNARQGSSRAGGSGAGGARGSDSSADTVLSNLLKGRAVSELTADEVFALLKPQMNMDWNADPVESARANYQYQLLTSKLPLCLMEEVLALARDGGVQPYRANQLFATYALRDWNKAMAWAGTQPDASMLRAAAISRLAQNDPAKASDLYQKELLEGSSRSGAWEASYNLAASYARLGQADFFRFLDGLPSGSVSNLLSNGARNIPKEDVATFLTEVEKRSAGGGLDSWAMNNLISNLAGTQAEEIRKWIGKMEPGNKRAEMEISLASSLSRQGKEADVDALLKSAVASAPGREKELVKERMGNLIGQDSELARKLVALLPEGQELNREDVKQWAGYGYGRPDMVLELSKLIGSPEEQTAYLVESFNGMGNSSSGGKKMNTKDFEILEHRLGTMDLSASARAQATTALSSARDRALGLGN